MKYSINHTTLPMVDIQADSIRDLEYQLTFLNPMQLKIVNQHLKKFNLVAIDSGKAVRCRNIHEVVYTN